MPRIGWYQLSPRVRRAVQERSGHVLTAMTATEGLNSEVAEFLHTATGMVFLKGRRCDHPDIGTQHREAMINPHVLCVAPRLLWRMEIDGWNFLAFERIQARHADYSPGSTDLSRVVEVMDRVGEVRCPDLPSSHTEHRWSAYVESESALTELAGDRLLHTDFNPMNILINDEDTYVIDWSAPTRGAAWIDAACLVIRLIAAGHTPAAAESWAHRTTAWTTASHTAVNTFALVSVRRWERKALEHPTPGKKRMAASALRWMAYRSTEIGRR